MSNRSSSKKHWCASVNVLRPKSTLKKRRNKAKGRVNQDERSKKRFSLFADAEKKLGSAI